MFAYSTDQNAIEPYSWSPKALKMHGMFIILLLIPYLLDYLICGGVVVARHDNLDSAVVYNRVIGQFYSGNTHGLNLFLGGVIKWYDLMNFLQPSVLLYAVFDTQTAYYITDISIRIIAYLTFFSLAKTLNFQNNVSLLGACFFAIGLSYPTLGLGVVASPYLLKILLSNKKLSTKEVLIIFLIGLNISLPIHGLFLLPIMFLVALILNDKGVVNRQFYYTYIGISAILIVSISLSNFGLVYGHFFSEVSHRSDWVTQSLDTRTNVMKLLNNVFFMTEFYHAVYTPAIYAFFLLLFAFVLGGKKSRLFATLITAVIFLTFLKNTSLMTHVVSQSGRFFKEVQLDRFYLFLGLLFSLLYLYLMRDLKNKLARNFINGLILFYIIVLPNRTILDVVHLSHLDAAHEFKVAIKSRDLKKIVHFIAVPIQNIKNKNPAISGLKNYTFSGYYQPTEYAHIKKIVGNSRVISIGLDPMIAVYNNIAVLDGYHNLYPLSYKRKFREIIKDQIQLSKEKSLYFDGWGSRVYTFVDDPNNIHLDFMKAAELGAEYVISKFKVINPHLSLAYAHSDRAGDIFLYKMGATN